MFYETFMFNKFVGATRGSEWTPRGWRAAAPYRSHYLDGDFADFQLLTEKVLHKNPFRFRCSQNIDRDKLLPLPSVLLRGQLSSFWRITGHLRSFVTQPRADVSPSWGRRPAALARDIPLPRYYKTILCGFWVTAQEKWNSRIGY